MQIHATNVQGLGASQVVMSFLNACSKNSNLDFSKIYLPSTGYLANYVPENGNIIKYKRIIPNGISRLIECLFSRFIFSNDKTIVLGDIPLRGIYNQIVLVHQSNLVYPRVNPYSSKSINFRISRLLFSLNSKYAQKIIVQSGSMVYEMTQSYPKIKDKIIVCSQPVPDWFDKNAKKNSFILYNNKKFKFFYPSAFYPHKMHKFLLSFDNYLLNNNIVINNIEIYLTLTEKEFEPYKKIKYLKNIGKLSSSEMNNYYGKVDALLFLSSLESYGLPLIEAMSLNLPILTVDLSYSRWVCEDHAYFFKPYDEESFFIALTNLVNDFNSGKQSDYTEALKKFPNSWTEVVDCFLI